MIGDLFAGDLGAGLGISISLQSFAARALLGSVVATVLAVAAAKLGLVRSGRARRTIILAPVAAAAAAGFACMTPGSTFFPYLLVAAPDGEVIEIFSEQVAVQRVEWLLVLWSAVASFLLLRRTTAHWLLRRYVVGTATAVESGDDDTVAVRRTLRTLSAKLEMDTPSLLLLRGCPGGAFTAGLRRPVVVLDPVLLDTLDDHELEGLLAHELAHIANRDVLLHTVVGVVRDLAFFLAPLNVAIRWLRHEREHAADDLASDITGRPAALASSILKVWEGTKSSQRPHVAAMACATMVPSLALRPAPVGPAGRWGGFARTTAEEKLRNRLSDGARQIAERVVRLIERGDPISLRRQRIEMVAALGAVAMATAVTIILPAQLNDELMLARWSASAAPVESPAMATFRALAPEETPLAQAIGALEALAAEAQTDGMPDVVACGDCVLVESAAEWRNGTVPTLPDRAAGWQGGGSPWAGADLAVPRPLSAEPLLRFDSSAGGGVAVFLVQTPRDS